jgi:hypothetical protein
MSKWRSLWIKKSWVETLEATRRYLRQGGGNGQTSLFEKAYALHGVQNWDMEHIEGSKVQMIPQI